MLILLHKHVVVVVEANIVVEHKHFVLHKVVANLTIVVAVADKMALVAADKTALVAADKTAIVADKMAIAAAVVVEVDNIAVADNRIAVVVEMDC
jgi:hypothetical protein